MGRRRTPIARWPMRAIGHAGSSRALTWRISSLSRSTTTPFCIRRRFSRADADAAATGAAVCDAQNREAPRHFASGRSWAYFEDKWRLAPIALGVKRSCSVLRLLAATMAASSSMPTLSIAESDEQASGTPLLGVLKTLPRAGIAAHTQRIKKCQAGEE